MEQDIRKLLNITVESPYWEDALAEAGEMEEIPHWLTDEFQLAMERELQIIGDDFDAAMAYLSKLRQNPALLLFCKVIYRILCRRKGFAAAFPTFEIPLDTSGDFDFITLLPLLAHVAIYGRELSQRGIDRQVIYDTLLFLRYSIKESHKLHGKPCFNTPNGFAIYGAYMYCNMLCVDPLRFEIHPNSDRKVRVFRSGDGKLCALMCDTTLHATGNLLGAIGFTDEAGAFDANFLETEEYYEGHPIDDETHLASPARIQLPKDQWEMILAPGDTLLKVHIPGIARNPFSKEACEAAYQKGIDIYKNLYPEYDFKGFVCNTWLLSPNLQKILKKDSNIVRFQEAYLLIPAKNNAPDVFHYVYGMNVQSAAEVDAATLPETNSLQRGVKKLLQEGIYIHQYNGFIPF